MKRSFWFVVVTAILCTLVISADILAEEMQQKEPSKFVQFWRRLFRYPAKVTEESVDITTEAVKGSSGAVTKTVEKTADVITGDVKKAPEVIVTPVQKTAETVAETTKRVVEMPVKAAEKTAEPTK